MRLLRSVWRFFARYLYGLEAIFLPNVCLVCGRQLLPSERCVCRLCLDGLPATMFEDFNDNPLERRMMGRVELRSGFSCFYFRRGEALRELVHDFKYHSNKELAREMGREMGRRALRSGFLAGYDVLVPVPLHPRRLRQRGYNQSLLLAQGVSEVTGLKVLPDALTRTAFAGSQTKLGAIRRFINVKTDFALGPDAPMLVGKSVLLIDDVFTTGATTESCVRALLAVEGVSAGVATLGFVQH